MTPHRPMPSIPLSLAEVNDVVAYILSLKLRATGSPLPLDVAAELG
jgi:hypothetical protein